MASTARIDELKKKFDENPRRYFAPLANEFRKAGDIEQAIRICEEFLPQQPGHMSGHIVYGQALFEASRFDESRTVFETALTLDPENLIALRHLGDIARGQGDLESARRWYDRVLEADPRNEEIQGLIAALSGASAETPASPAGAPDSAPSVDAASSAPPAEQRFAPPPALPELLDLDVHGDFAPPTPERVSAPSVAAERHSTVAPAEGLESVEFVAPSGPVDRAHDLGASLEAGEFTAPAAPIAPLDGLEETSIGAFERSVPDGGPPLPMLDTSEPSSASPSAGSTELPEVGPSTLEFTVPTAADRAAVEGRAETSTMPELESEGDSLPGAGTEVPPELPPAVIAAESELMDLGEPISGTRSDAPAAAAMAAAPEYVVPAAAPAPPAPQAPFVTETMAELFLRQGFRDRALDVYRQLLAANPADERLQRRVAELQPAAPAAAGESVRDFLARIAALRPGERAASAAPPSDEDFASLESDAASTAGGAPAPAAPSGGGGETSPDAAPASTMSTGLERGAATQGSTGSIDALFGNRAAGTSEDSAASALAQAFGASAEPAPVITGRPARAAAGELSLDSVFRDGPPRPPRASQSFSFDQFFSPESAAPERSPAPAPPTDQPAASEPAERGTDDIEQFNSWLQGLKPK